MESLTNLLNALNCECLAVPNNSNAKLSDVVIFAPSCRIRSMAMGTSHRLCEARQSATTKGVYRSVVIVDERRCRAVCITQMWDFHDCVRLYIRWEKFLNRRTSIPKITTFLMAGRDLRMFSMSGVTIENVLLSKVPKCRDPRDPRLRAGSRGPKAVCRTTFFERQFLLEV